MPVLAMMTNSVSESILSAPTASSEPLDFLVLAASLDFHDNMRPGCTK